MDSFTPGPSPRTMEARVNKILQECEELAGTPVMGEQKGETNNMSAANTPSKSTVSLLELPSRTNAVQTEKVGINSSTNAESSMAKPKFAAKSIQELIEEKKMQDIAESKSFITENEKLKESHDVSTSVIKGKPSTSTSTAVDAHEHAKVQAAVRRTRPTYSVYACDVCGKSPIKVCRWECNICEEFDQCEKCYKSGKHGHPCTRFLINDNAAASINIEPPPLERQASSSTLERRSYGIGPSTYLKNLCVRLGIRVKVLGKKAESCLQGFEVAIDLFMTKQKITKKEVPVSVERVFLCNSIVLLGISPSFGCLSADINDDLPFAAGKISTILLCAIEQILFLEKESAWFANPVPKSIPNYHETIKEPMDLGTIKKKIEDGTLIKSTSKEGLLNLIKECSRLIELVWLNAQTFNPPKHVIHKVAVDLNEKSARVIANILFLWEVTRELLKRNGLQDFWSQIPTSLQDIRVFNESQSAPPPPLPFKRGASNLERGYSNDPRPGKRKKKESPVPSPEAKASEVDDSEATDSSGSVPKRKNGSFKPAVKRQASMGNRNVNLKLASLRKDVVTLMKRMDKLEKYMESILDVVNKSKDSL